MKRKFLIIIFAVILTLVWQKCSLKSPDESDFPSWLVELNLPLYEKTFYADSLIDNSSIIKEFYQGDSIFAFQDTSQNIEKMEIGDKLEIDNINQSFNQNIDDISVDNIDQSFSYGMDTVGVPSINQRTAKKIGNLSLENIAVETDPVEFDNIYPEARTFPLDSVTIPKDLEFPPIYRSINLTNIENAEFAEGLLILRINNNLVVEMGRPISIQLCRNDADTSEVSGLSASWEDNGNQGIMPGETASRTIDLADKEFPGDLIVKIEGVLCGSGSQKVDKDSALASSFSVEVETRDLLVSSATAKLPGQEIDSSSTIQLEHSDNKVEEAEILNGNIEINLANQLDLDAILHLEISNLRDRSETPFREDIPVSANTADISSKNNISGYKIIMDPDNQQIDYSYTIETLSSDDEMATINSSDSVIFNVSIYGETPDEDITFEKFKGKIAQESIVEQGELPITTGAAQIKQAIFAGGKLDITVNNQISTSTSPAYPTIEIEIPDILDNSNNPLTIGPLELINGNNNIPVNDNNNSLSGYVIKPDNYNNELNQKLSYSAAVNIPSKESGEYKLLDSIHVDIEVSEMDFREVTGRFNQDPIIKEDSIAIHKNHKLDLAKIQSGELLIDFTNNLGAEANINLEIADIVRKDNGNIFSSTINLTETGNNTKSFDLSQYNINLDMKHIDSAQYVGYYSKIDIPSDQEMTLNLEKKLRASIALQNLKFQEIQGYIDTVTVDLDTTSQKIESFPEELDGVNLRDVNIVLDLNTNIGVPFDISIYMEAANSKGEKETINVDQTVLPTDPATHQINIPDAETLINLKPDQILAYGRVRVYGQGTVSKDQYVEGKIKIRVPFIIELEDEATIEMDPQLTSEEEMEIPDNIEALRIGYNINNSFDFGCIANILVAKDSNYFHTGSDILPDTLLKNIRITPDGTFQDSIALNKKKIELFKDSLFVKPDLILTGPEDNISKVLKKDSIKISLWGRVIGKIDTSLVK
mgnify:CR=1 FL=1